MRNKINARWRPYSVVLPTGVVYYPKEFKMTDLEDHSFKTLFGDLPNYTNRLLLILAYRQLAVLTTTAILKAKGVGRN